MRYKVNQIKVKILVRVVAVGVCLSALGTGWADEVSHVVMADGDSLYLVVSAVQGEVRCVVCPSDESVCAEAIHKDTDVIDLSAQSLDEVVTVAGIGTDWMHSLFIGTALVGRGVQSTMGGLSAQNWTVVLLAVVGTGLLASVLSDLNPEEFHRLVGSVGVPEYDEVPLSRDEKYAQIVRDLREQSKVMQAESQDSENHQQDSESSAEDS